VIITHVLVLHCHRHNDMMKLAGSMRHDMSKLQAEACMNVIGAAAWSSATLLRLLDTTLVVNDVSVSAGSGEHLIEMQQESSDSHHHKGLKRLRKALAAGQTITPSPTALPADGNSSSGSNAAVKRCATRQWPSCLTTASNDLLVLLEQAMSTAANTYDKAADAVVNAVTSKAPAATGSKKGAASVTTEVTAKSIAAVWLESMVSVCSTTVSYLTPAHRRVIRAREEIIKVQICDLKKRLTAVTQTYDDLLRDEEQASVEWVQMVAAIQAGADLY
jgi:hypothetical protein